MCIRSLSPPPATASNGDKYSRRSSNNSNSTMSSSTTASSPRGAIAISNRRQMMMSAKFQWRSPSRQLECTSNEGGESKRSFMMSTSDSPWRTAYRDLSVLLKVERLESLLCDTCAAYCEDEQIKKLLRFQVRALAHTNRSTSSSTKLKRRELSEILSSFKSVMYHSPNLPEEMVPSFHSTIGLLQQFVSSSDEQQTTADSAFVEGLQIETLQEHPNVERVAQAVYRLGLVCQSSFEAIQALSRAQRIYTNVGLPKDHPYQVNVQDVLNKFLQN